MNSQELPSKDGPLTVNEQVPVTTFLFQLKCQRCAPVPVISLSDLSEAFFGLFLHLLIPDASDVHL